MTHNCLPHQARLELSAEPEVEGQLFRPLSTDEELLPGPFRATTYFAPLITSRIAPLSTPWVASDEPDGLSHQLLAPLITSDER